jgi:phenylpropionate dioxygenase-like ring-hydroxylating dioxygenase large terminal subunit
MITKRFNENRQQTFLEGEQEKMKTNIRRNDDWEALENALVQYWHPVARSEEIDNKAVPIKLLDQTLVLWRSRGQIAAFHDLCVHRGTPLSLGWIDGDQLICAYHGWHYGVDGSCTRIPSLPAGHAIPTKARAKVYSVQERYGLVWVCLDEPRAEIPVFPPEFNDPSYRWDVYSSEGQWNANAARMIENLADFSHFPWVHPGILGDREKPEYEAVRIEPVEGGFQYESDDGLNPFRSESRARRLFTVILPFMVMIQAWESGRMEKSTKIYLCTPISSNETKFYRFAGRNYRDRRSDKELNDRHRLIFEQDRVIVEAQRPEELPLDLSEELHLRGPDSTALEYTRRLREIGRRN